MSFRLVPLIAGSAPQIALHRPVLLIGRHLDCDVRIDSQKISRRHCCVAMAYDRVLIRDLGTDRFGVLALAWASNLLCCAIRFAASAFACCMAC